MSSWKPHFGAGRGLREWVQPLILYLGKMRPRDAEGGQPSTPASLTSSAKYALEQPWRDWFLRWAGYIIAVYLRFTIYKMGPIKPACRLVMRVKRDGVWEALGTLPSVVAAAVILLLVFPHCAGWQVLPWGGRLQQ